MLFIICQYLLLGSYVIPIKMYIAPDMLSYVDTKLIRTCLAFQELPLEKREKKSCYLSRGIVVSKFFLTNMSR